MPIIDPSEPRSFGEILGGLMGAVIDAQAQSARATIDFIAEVGTIQGSLNSDVKNELRNISFNYIKNDENGLPAKFTLELPLLSLVEIPSIAIKTANFSFYFDVHTTKDPETEENEVSDGSSGVKTKGLREWLGIKKPVKVVGRVNKETNQTSNIEKNAGIKVEVVFEKSSLQIGIDRILDMLQLAATETPNKNP